MKIMSTMRLGGGKETIEAVRAAGRLPGALRTWEGSWVLRHGYGHFEDRCRLAKSLGVPLVVQDWFWGDDISPEAIRNGVNDQYQNNADGTPIFKTREKAYTMGREMASRGKALGMSVLFVIDTEGNKGSTMGSPEWLDYYETKARIYHDAGHKVVWAPGWFWQDPATIVAKEQRALAVTDYYGARVMTSRVRSNSTDYANVADRLLAIVEDMGTHTGKPGLVTDFAVSSYGGNFQTTKPFAPIGYISKPTTEAQKVENARLLAVCGAAYETQQAAVFKRMVELKPRFTAAGIADIGYRSIDDDPNFDPSNYYGYGEKFWGLRRKDGTKKPGFDAFLSIADTSAPTPPPSLDLVLSAKMHLPQYEHGNGVVCGEITIKSNIDVTLPRIVLAARPPGGTHAGGPYRDIGGASSVILKAGVPMSFKFERPFTVLDTTGEWYAYCAVRKPDGTWQDSAPDVPFRVIASCR